MVPEIEKAKREIASAKEEVQKDIANMISWRKRNTYSIYTLIVIWFGLIAWVGSAQSRLFDTVRQKERTVLHTENVFYSELQAKTFAENIKKFEIRIDEFENELSKRDSIEAARQKIRDSLDLLNKTTIYQMKEKQEEVLKKLDKILNKEQ